MLKKLTSLFVILIVFFSTFMVYAQTNTSSKFISKRKFTNTCKTPENILACELKLNECPSQCRPSSCKIPENILACDLKLNECPSECRFGRTNKVVIDICKTPENVLACDLKLNKCPSQCRPSSCKTPESILACSLKLNECSSECRFNW